MKKIAFVVAGYFYLFFAFPAYAQITQLQGSGCLTGGATRQVATLDCLPIIITNIITVLLVLAGLVAVFMIIYSGLKFITSGGDAKQAEGARKTLTFAVIGLTLVMLVFVIVPAIGKLTGIRRECIFSFGFSQCVPEDISFPCSDAHPNGFCEEGRECVRDGGADTFSCRFPCSGEHRNGFCRTGTCQRRGGENDFICK